MDEKPVVFEIWGNAENGGAKKGTRLLVTKKVFDFLMKTNEKEAIYDSSLAKLRVLLEHGLDTFIGHNPMIKHEWDGVYRLFIKKHYRIIGFFYRGFEEFIAIDYYEKKATKLNAIQIKCINKVAVIKRDVSFINRN